MSITLLMDGGDGEVRLAVLAGERLLDLYYFRDSAPSLYGAVFLARVTQASPAHNGAFLDLDGSRQGFLKIRHGRPPVEGSALVVTVRAEGTAGKLPICTADVGGEMAPDGLHAPALISLPTPPWGPILNQFPDAPIVADTADLAARIRRPYPDRIITIHRSAAGAFEDFGVEAEIAALVNPALPLPSGGAIRIEAATALTAIDVDLGQGDKRRGAALAANREAAAEIARQLRLRRISGLVVIDFLKMDRWGEEDIATALKAALAPDPTPTEIGRFSRFGLLELRRPRGRRPLLEDLTSAPSSSFTPETLGHAALRQARRAMDAAPGSQTVIRAHPLIIGWLQTHADGPGQPLTLVAEEDWARERIDVYTRRP